MKMTKQNHEERITALFSFTVGGGMAAFTIYAGVPIWMVTLFLVGLLAVAMTLMCTFYLNYTRKS